MKTILVPTDFSKAAINAAEYAAHFAKDVKAKLILLHVYPVPTPVTEIVINKEELQKEHESHLKKVAKHLKKIADVEVNYMAKMGLAVHIIQQEERNATLILMGMRGADKFSKALMGSTTTFTLRKTQIPVLVIPEKAKYKKPEKIAFACDHDPLTGVNTLDALKALMQAFASKVYVVNIKRKKESVTVNEAMAGFRLESKQNDVVHLYYFPEKADLVEGIIEFANEKKVDMITIIPRRYSLLERLFRKSVSKKMAFHSHIPMLALPVNLGSIDAGLS